jgi:Lrp/AsnC family transcriptional regulator, leucine-responsive regulatory protein
MANKVRRIGEIKGVGNSISLDKKNHKLLTLLMLNARTQNSQIAKSVGLSKSNIARRISILEDKELITGYHAFVDGTKVGLNSSAVILQTKCTEEQKEEYVEGLVDNPWIYASIEMVGKNDLLIAFYYKDVEQKNILVEEILREDLIKDFKLFDFTTLFPKLDYTNVKVKATGEYSREFSLKEKVKQIDKLDLKLLMLLSENCRLSLVDLSERAKAPRETVNYRIKKLISCGAIVKFQPTVNFFLLGFESYVLSLKISKPTQMKKIIDYLSSTGRCNTILDIKGASDLIAFIHFQNNKKFREFENDLLKNFKEIIYEHSFDLVKKQYKLDWFSKELEKELLRNFKK